MTEQDAIALAMAEMAVGAYAPVRSAYATEINGAIIEYLFTDKARVTKFRNRYKKAVTDYFDQAFRMGYTDSGGDPKEMDAGDQEWLSAAITGEWGFVDDLFVQMKDVKQEFTNEEMIAWSAARAEGYAKTLDGVYNQGKLRGLKGIMLTFTGDDGAESCSTCQRLKGKRHSAKWWIKRGLTIFRGNRSFECGCWQCAHFFMTDKGEVYTL
jgi:uncharacterized cupin superfamily protein